MTKSRFIKSSAHQLAQPPAQLTCQKQSQKARTERSTIHIPHRHKPIPLANLVVNRLQNQEPRLSQKHTHSQRRSFSIDRTQTPRLPA